MTSHDSKEVISEQLPVKAGSLAIPKCRDACRAITKSTLSFEIIGRAIMRAAE